MQMYFLQAEPFYVISLEEIFWGGILMAITMTVHGFGMLIVLRINQTVKEKIGSKVGVMPGLFPIILASFLIMIVHLIDVMIWAFFFLWKDAFHNNSIAYYFSLNEYTTVGSPFNLPQRWRLLEGLLATTGLLTFAWSTGVLITLAKEFENQRMAFFNLGFAKKQPAGTTESDKNEDQTKQY
jgi:hypothetical protein